MYDLKIYRGAICQENAEWCKVWRGIDLSFQNWHEQFDKFWPEHSKVSKTFALMGYFWAKYILVELKKVKRSYLAWHGQVMKNLERTWRVVSKLTWGIWQILTRPLESLKNLHFNGFFLINSHNVWTKKSTKELCLIGLKTDAKFEGKLNCAFKNDIRNLWQVFTDWIIISFCTVKSWN